MSLRKYFQKAQEIKNLSNLSEEEVAGEVESVGFHEADVVKDNRFIPAVDYSDPANFARYGSAVEYYDRSIKWIYGDYPYDGSLREKLEWENSSSYVDLYIFENKYPRSNGYALFSADGWGALASTAHQYGTPSNLEYIYIKGGPNTNPDGMSPFRLAFTGSNYHETASNRASNLEFDLVNKGASVEFWLKKTAFDEDLTGREVIFDLWNLKNSGSDGYGRLRVEVTGGVGYKGSPFLITCHSGSSTTPYGFVTESVGLSLTGALETWSHYAVTFKSASDGVDVRLYKDGALNHSVTTGSNIGIVTGALNATIGALIVPPNNISESGSAGAGKLSGSIDEFRYWKTQRSSKDIGRYWFTQVGGGTNSDPTPGRIVTSASLANTRLGVYYKFNEGITGDATTDAKVLDYSGRISNGTWTGYDSYSRNTGSAILSASAAIREFEDPIIYDAHPDVVSLSAELAASGSQHDATNNASLFNAMPTWVIEEDELGSKDLKYLTQIMGSYFDTLHLQIESLNRLKDKTYITGSDKPLTFANRLLEQAGLISPEMFLDVDILEKLADRSEKRLYEKNLTDIKNSIYQNIYNNLSYIYKSKGAEKSFRNLIRCYGIDDELIKFNMYANNIEFELRNNVTSHVLAKRYADFNTTSSIEATVYQSGSYISGSRNLSDGFAFTAEANVIFPEKLSRTDKKFIGLQFISASIFGLHSSSHETQDAMDPEWAEQDAVNFQVYAVRDELGSPNAKFVLTGTAGGYVPRLTSSLYEDVYDNTNWNLAVRIKPEKYPYANLIMEPSTGSVGPTYIVEFHGINMQDGTIINEFNATGSITAPPKMFVTGSRRLYGGAHRTNFTGSLLQYSDIKLGSIRYWFNYLENTTLAAHAKDIQNHGTLRAASYPYLFQPSASFGELSEQETLALNWEFTNITGSDANGQFTVYDISTDSTSPSTGSYGWLGPLLLSDHEGKGYGFASNDTTAIDKDYVTAVRQNLPENLKSQDMITIYNEIERDLFTKETRPVNFSFAFEKSIYQNISEQMLNYFSTLHEFHNLIGEPVNRYRMNYKLMEKARTAFFEKVQNNKIDFEKFYEFYKWFDSSLSIMLNQLAPASADIVENIRTMIESHALERNKYQFKFPTLEDKSPGACNSKCALEIGTVYMASEMAPGGKPGNAGSLGTKEYTPRQVGTYDCRKQGGWKWQYAPVDGDQKKNKDWWKYRAEKYGEKYGGKTSVNYSRQGIFKKMACEVGDRISKIYRFSVSEEPTFPSTNLHPSKRWGAIYNVVAPAGPLIEGLNIPANVALISEVEKLIDSNDNPVPHRKQRLGFSLNARINKPSGHDYLNADGNIIAPFSIYSSSVTTGQNAQVVNKFTGNVEITNLHHDMYGTYTETPLQGPFSETWVGGREHRHVRINRYDPAKKGDNNLDSALDRPEGFKLLLGPDLGPQGLDGAYIGGIVGPQYPEPESPEVTPPYLFYRPKGNMTRGLITKRPVNIKNILMTSASLSQSLSGVLTHGRVGNYQHNYQVIQSVGRSTNDPFWQDQSFTFAANPQSPYPRLSNVDQLPVQNIRVKNTKAASINDNSPYNCYVFASDSAMNANSAETWAFWLNLTNPDELNFIFADNAAGDRYISLTAANTLAFKAYHSTTDGVWQTDAAITTGNEWVHVAVTYNGNSNANDAVFYINGEKVASTNSTSPVGTLEAYGGNINLGYPNANGFEGYMSDVAFYNINLTACEIKAIYSNSTLDLINHGPPRAASNLIFWWRMGDGAGDVAATIVDQKGNANLTAVNSPTIIGISPDDCLVTANDNNFALPNRQGANSNKTIFVNLFSAPGSYETLSRGYLDTAHEEKSVYNALPFRNLSIRASGSGESGSLHVQSHITGTAGRRALRTLLTLHAGPFGTDAQYGSVLSAIYNTTPSFHKVNRNRKYRYELKPVAASAVDCIDTTGLLADRYNDASFTISISVSAGGLGGTAVTILLDASESTSGTGGANQIMIGTDDGITDAARAALIIKAINGDTDSKVNYATSGNGQAGDDLGITAAEGSSDTQITLTMDAAGAAGNIASALASASGVDIIDVTYFTGGGNESEGDAAATLTGSVRDNWWVQHPIPRAARNYAWITASLPLSSDYYTYIELSGGFLTSTPSISGADILTTELNSTTPGYIRDFIGTNTLIKEPVSCSQNQLGYAPSIGLGSLATLNPAGSTAIDKFSSLASNFNMLMLHRNGPYQYPSWKQIRTGEHPVVRDQKEINIMSVRDEPTQFTYLSSLGSVSVAGLKGNTFTSYIEQPVSSRHHPVAFFYKTGDVAALSRVTWANNLDYLSNESLNNKLDIAKDVELSQPYYTIVNTVLNTVQNNEQVVEYSERIYPREVNAYQNRVRARTQYTVGMGLQSSATSASIWNSSRSIRSNVNTINSQGHTINNMSRWPLDGHIDFTTTYTLATSSDAGTNGREGELLNKFCRYGTTGSFSISASALYAMPVPVGSASVNGDPIYNGDALWQLGTGSNAPYRTYEDYMIYLRLTGKDHTIVPEFRISDHIERYINASASNWLTALDNSTPGMFEITGAYIDNSFDDGVKVCEVVDTDKFYNVYGHTDFLKYFKVIDDDLNNRETADGTKIRKSLLLECSAKLKFLPYKGFYPVERTVELARLFSQSYGPQISASNPQAYRAVLEPLYAPGIMYNTIKSGIGVGSFIVYNASYDPDDSESAVFDVSKKNALNSADTTLPEGTINFGQKSILSMSAYPEKEGSTGGYSLQRIPFEAILKPEAYLNTGLRGNVSGSVIFDSGIGSASLSGNTAGASALNHIRFYGAGSKLYGMAIDNFLCNTADFFLEKSHHSPNGLTTLLASKEETQYTPLVEDQVYAVTINLYRTLKSKNGISKADFDSFSLYNNAGAFGPPFCLDCADADASTGNFKASFAPVTPSYFYGTSSVTIIYKAPFTGQPTFDDIRSRATFVYSRQMEEQTTSTSATGYWFAQQITGSLKVMEKVNANGVRWMIQSKFETPVLNFADSNAEAPLTSPKFSITGSNPISTKGIWHQLGEVPKDSSKGIFVSVTTPETVIDTDGTTYRRVKPLAPVVGLDDFEGRPVRIGDVATKRTLEEAVVAIPFTVKKGRRKFFNMQQGNPQYPLSTALLQKYIFPPTFDYVLNNTKPILFYAFEFTMDIDREDISKLWQNIMFDSGASSTDFDLGECATINNQLSSCVLEDQDLIKQIYGCIDDLKWLVFKVKKRGVRDYNRYIKGNIPGIPTNQISKIAPNVTEKYTYNWPYDYFSLVELVKMDATVRYSATDAERIIQPAFTPAQTPTAELYTPGRIMEQAKGEVLADIDTKDLGGLRLPDLIATTNVTTVDIGKDYSVADATPGQISIPGDPFQSDRGMSDAAAAAKAKAAAAAKYLQGKSDKGNK